MRNLTALALAAAYAVSMMPAAARADEPDSSDEATPSPMEPGAPNEDPKSEAPRSTGEADGPIQVQTGGKVIVIVGPGDTPAEAPPAALPAPVEPPPPAQPPTPRYQPVPPPSFGPPGPDTTYDDAADREAARPKRTHFAFRLGLGPSVYAFHSDAIYMMGGSLALGADTRRGTFQAVFAAEGGRTEAGLTTWRQYFGAEFSWLVGPLRLGIEPRFGTEHIDRITTDDSLVYVTLGLAGVVSVDLMNSHGSRLALAVRPCAEFADQLALFGAGDSAGLLGATASLEFRWRAPARPPKKPKRLALSEDPPASSPPAF